MSEFRYTQATSVDELLTILFDRSQPEQRRVDAIHDLSSHFQGDWEIFLPILADKSESPAVRGEVADQFSFGWSGKALPTVLDALQDESVEVRFWAAFAMVNLQHRRLDLTSALDVIESVALSQYAMQGRESWWSPAREILPALENYFVRQFYPKGLPFWLLSPMPEYATYQQVTQPVDGERRVFVPFTWETSLRHDPAVMREQLRARFSHWKGFALNVRQPRLRCYLLDWQMGSRHTALTGALLNDGYAIVINANMSTCAQFVTWYRTILPANTPLFAYEWADAGVEIPPGVNAALAREILETHLRTSWTQTAAEHQALVARFAPNDTEL